MLCLAFQCSSNSQSQWPVKVEREGILYIPLWLLLIKFMSSAFSLLDVLGVLFIYFLTPIPYLFFLHKSILPGYLQIHCELYALSKLDICVFFIIFIFLFCWPYLSPWSCNSPQVSGHWIAACSLEASGMEPSSARPLLWCIFSIIIDHLFNTETASCCSLFVGIKYATPVYLIVNNCCSR